MTDRLMPTPSWRDRWDDEAISLILSLYRNEDWKLARLRIPRYRYYWALVDEDNVPVKWFPKRALCRLFRRDPDWFSVCRKDTEGTYYQLSKWGKVSGLLWRYWDTQEERRRASTEKAERDREGAL